LMWRRRLFKGESVSITTVILPRRQPEEG
jgi:hypothetical protein